jgi:hypothetical protein
MGLVTDISRNVILKVNFLIFVFLLGGCVSPEYQKSEMERSIQNLNTSEENNASISDEQESSSFMKNIVLSEDFCHSIILERTKLLCHTTDNEKNTGRMTCIRSPEMEYQWSDGAPIKGTIWFEQGWRTGENVNSLYSANYLEYEKIPISEDGTIGEKVSYRVMWILDPTDMTEEGFKVKLYKCCKNTKYSPCNINSESYKNW